MVDDRESLNQKTENGTMGNGASTGERKQRQVLDSYSQILLGTKQGLNNIYNNVECLEMGTEKGNQGSEATIRMRTQGRKWVWTRG